MPKFSVQLMDPAEPDSGESDGEQAPVTTNNQKFSEDALRIAGLLRMASLSHWTKRYLILIRGLPGSGKTTLARFLVQHVQNSVIVSESDYYNQSQTLTTVPVYRSEQLEEAKAACKQKAWTAIRSDVLALVVDNENLKTIEMEPYVVEAVKRDYSVHLLEPNTRWRYNPRKLIRLTRKPVTLQDLQRMLASFDRSITAEDLVHEARKKLSTMMTLLTPAPQADSRSVDGHAEQASSSKLQANPSKEQSGNVVGMSVPGCGTIENKQWETVEEVGSTKGNEVLPHRGESPPKESNPPELVTDSVAYLSSACCSSSTTFHPELDLVDHLATVFPNMSREHIREFLELAAGDIEWASSLILEGVQLGTDVQSTSPSNCVSSTIAAVASADAHDTTEPLQLDEPSNITKLDSETGPVHSTESAESQPPDTVNSTESTVDAIKGFKLTRDFIREAHQLYGFALGVPSLDLSDAAVPDFLIDEWYPEPELVREILQSFLRFLGVTQVPGNGSRSNCRPTGPGRSNQQKRRNHNRANQPTNFTEIMDDDEVIHRSVQDFRSSLDAPVVRRIIDRLSEKFPKVQRATVEETFVKADFSEVETENQLSQSFASSRPSQAINDRSSTEQAPSVSTDLSAGQAPLEQGLTLQEIQEEEEALRRSVEDQKVKMQSLACQLSLCRLKSQFPDVQLLELENLFIRFDLSEQNVTEYLLNRGFSAHPIGPLITNNNTDESGPLMTATEQSESFALPVCDLDVLNAQLSVVRQRICQIRQRMYKRTEKGVGHYYSSELGRLYREQRALSLARARHTIDLRSTEIERELLSSGDSETVAASKAFAHIDLHGLDKTCALTVLKQRMQLLESRSQRSGPSSPSCAIVITGRGGSVESDAVHTSPILRPAVMNYLTANEYSFCEKYTPGSGYFTVTLPRHRVPIQCARR